MRASTPLQATSTNSSKNIQMTIFYKVLFLCTGNSARSILAEALLNHLGNARFQAYSAGSHPTGRVNPYALRQLEAEGIHTEGLRSKSWDEFSAIDAPKLDLIITVCGNAETQSCPVFFGDFLRSHWGLDDPAAVDGSEATKHAAFGTAYQILRFRIEQLLALPWSTERTIMQMSLDHIGKSLP